MKRKLTIAFIAVFAGIAGSTTMAVAADAEGKAAVCAGCHGPNGHSTVPDNPILAGQHADYLASALKSYIKGERDHGIMKTMASRLSAEDLEEIAAYYAAQSRKQSQARAEGDAVAGKGKVAGCAGCHGPAGLSAIPGNPNLAGQHAAYLVTSLQGYKSGARKNAIMTSIVSALSDRDIADIAAFYAGQSSPPQAAATATASESTDPEAKVAVCAGCHGPQGNSVVPENPILAGQSAQYLSSALQSYSEGDRQHGIMRTMARRLSAQDTEEITAYYADQPPARSERRVRGDAAAGEGKTATCAGCHGPGGHSAIPGNPSLAGQHAEYLTRALKAYQDGTRSNPMMTSLAASLSEQDIEDIAAYYATQPSTPDTDS